MRAVLRAVEFCEVHFAEDLAMGGAADAGAMTPRHLRRAFRQLTGESPRGFVRRLRLERAAHLLLLTQRSAMEIALDCGFDSREGFVRAFNDHFQRSPEQYRSAHQGRMDRRLGECERHFGQGRVVVEQREFLPRRLAYLRCRGGMLAILSAWWRMLRWARRYPPLDTAYPVDLTYDTDGITPATRQRCDVGLLIPEGFDPGEQMGLKTLPGGTHLVMHYSGPARLLPVAWEWLVFCWMRRHQYAPRTPYGITCYPPARPRHWWDMLGHLRRTDARLEVPVVRGDLFNPHRFCLS